MKDGKEEGFMYVFWSKPGRFVPPFVYASTKTKKYKRPPLFWDGLLQKNLTTACYFTTGLVTFSISSCTNSINSLMCSGEKSNFKPAASYNRGNVLVPPNCNALM